MPSPCFLPAFFVVINITPFAASDPYKAAAFAPFKTSMFSISSGLMLFTGLPKSRSPFSPDPFSTGMPSITNKGWLFPVSELLPLKTTRVDAPGPPPEMICIPATLPASMSNKLLPLASVIEVGSMFCLA
ncbi:hypothetical protein D3C86_843610 [compost metagenome]